MMITVEVEAIVKIIAKSYGALISKHSDKDVTHPYFSHLPTKGSLLFTS